MASVNTNAAAITALRTLQQTSASLDKTQNRISTGFKIGEAKDNAAYWSIATTLRSDNKALGTVKDALNLGSATIDVAYQSMNKALEVLNEMKSKLVAATQDGVDKTKIQSELAELQKQLKAISSSASFSGENWLDINSSDGGYQATKKVVSGYTRSSNGEVTISTIELNSSSLVLIDRATGAEGILDGGAAGNAGKGGLSLVTQAGTGGVAGSKGFYTSLAPDMTVGTNAATNITAAGSTFSLSVKIDGVVKTFNAQSLATETALTGGTTNTVAEVSTAVVNVLNANADFLKVATAEVGAGNTIKITSKTFGATSSAEITALTFAGTGAHSQTAAITATGFVKTDGVNAKLQLAAFSGDTLELDANDLVTFDVKVDGGAATRVTITKALITSVLPSSNGKVDNIDDYRAVMTEALRVSGLTNVVVGKNVAGTELTLTGGTQTIEISAANASKGTDLTSFDITTATVQQLSSLIAAVNTASEQVTSAAATLGSVASRIDLQTSFVNTLMDTIDKGVGNLVDADMSEESTKLQALQVKQQLGVQSLSIANQSAQNILSLFQTN